eukprot:s738_g5.t2
MNAGVALDYAPTLKGSWGRALVLAPAMLVRGEDSVWQRELREASAQWQEQLKVWSWHGERAIDLRYEVNTAHWKGPIVELYDVVLTSYESFLLNQDKFLQESWTCVVLDEAQTIKNHASQTSHAVKRLSEVPYRLALTGSPIENSLDDMHSILQFVEPSCVGTLQDFREKFAQNDEGRSSLQKLLQFLMLRRESGEAIQLVAKEEVEVAVKMAEDQAKIYEVLKDGLDSPENSFHKLFRDMELLCSHPWCYLQRNTGEDLTEDALVRRGVRRAKVQFSLGRSKAMSSKSMTKSVLVTGAVALAATRTAFITGVPLRVSSQSGSLSPSGAAGGTTATAYAASGGSEATKTIGLTSAMLATSTALAMTRFVKRRSQIPRKAVESKKTQCVHPDKPMMFACADCPLRGKSAGLDDEPLAAAAFVGECACSNASSNSKKTQCVHPDKPMMFACADCPRRGKSAGLDGEAVCSNANSKKTQCVHPDKPMMFACADCPRRGKSAGLDDEPLAAQCQFQENSVRAPRQAHDVCLRRLP